tara:strand:+ start:199 stop:396 length:198 start_codon:yes stop_codon:yes gene_type:complete
MKNPPNLTPKDFVTHVITMLYSEPFDMHSPEDYQKILRDLATQLNAETPFDQPVSETVYLPWEDS